MIVPARRLIAATVFMACALTLVGCTSSVTSVQAAAAPGQRPAVSVPPTPTRPPPQPPAQAARPVVVAIGDSIMEGYGLSTAEAWPAILAQSDNWTLTNLACAGAGFVNVGLADDCGSTYSKLASEAVALKPALILISGSSNDLGADNGELLQQTDALMTTLRANLPTTTIVGISPVWNDTATPAQMNDINQQVHQAINAVNGIYLDIGQPFTDQRELLQSDDEHPTADGQKLLAEAIQKAAEGANLSFVP